MKLEINHRKRNEKKTDYMETKKHATKKQNKTEYTFFSSEHGTLSRTDHILGHKTNLNKFKSTEIISSIFSDHNGMKLEINHRKRRKNCLYGD